MHILASLLALTVTCATTVSAVTKNASTQFYLMMKSSDSCLNGYGLFDPNYGEGIDEFASLGPANYGYTKTPFFIDSLGRLATNVTSYTGEERVVYSNEPDYTGDLNIDDVSDLSSPVYFPPFTIAANGSFSPGSNLTWGYCPDVDGVGNDVYTGGSITIGIILKGCSKIDEVIAVNA